MIRLIDHNGVEILLNVDAIQTVETGPPTVITLTNGDTLTVKNHPGDIAEKIRAYRQGKQQGKKGEETEDTQGEA